MGEESAAESPEPEPQSPPEDAASSAIVEGGLRAPWKWESLIVEASVVGGDPERWRRRLRGLRAGYDAQIKEELKREDPESPKLAGLERDRQNVLHLTQFALPIVETLASWPSQATWGEWIERFGELAPRVLRRPARVLRVLGELRAMSAIGPVGLEEARDVLAERLRTFEEQPPGGSLRQGVRWQPAPGARPGVQGRFRTRPRRTHVSSEAARGSAAPRRGDAAGRSASRPRLAVQDDRGKIERLLLHLAVGAATERLWLSYPRLDVAGARPRVPSFYALDVMRAILGRIPHHEKLQRQAAAAGGAKLDWPAPALPADAIDEVEHDLATLRQLIDMPDRAAVRGHAHYLLGLNPALRRSVTRRWARARSKWMPQDGLVRVTSAVKPMLDSAAARRPAVLGIRPAEIRDLPVPVRARRHLPLRAQRAARAAAAAGPVDARLALSRSAGQCPARVARQRPAAARPPPPSREALRDARRRHSIRRHPSTKNGSHRRSLASGATRSPLSAETSESGSASCQRPRRGRPRTSSSASASLTKAATSAARPSRSASTIASSCAARSTSSSRCRATAELRITDHKTGRNRTNPRTIIGGGGMLQPVLYGLAIEETCAGRCAKGACSTAPLPVDSPSTRSR